MHENNHNFTGLTFPTPLNDIKIFVIIRVYNGQDTRGEIKIHYSVQY